MSFVESCYRRRGNAHLHAAKRDLYSSYPLEFFFSPQFLTQVPQQDKVPFEPGPRRYGNFLEDGGQRERIYMQPSAHGAGGKSPRRLLNFTTDPFP